MIENYVKDSLHKNPFEGMLLTPKATLTQSRYFLLTIAITRLQIQIQEFLILKI